MTRSYGGNKQHEQRIGMGDGIESHAMAFRRHLCSLIRTKHRRPGTLRRCKTAISINLSVRSRHPHTRLLPLLELFGGLQRLGVTRQH
eukprot:425261-Hanusia_phi.AAC.2